MMRVLHLISNHKFTGPVDPALGLVRALVDLGVECRVAVGRPPAGDRGLADILRQRELDSIEGLELPKHRRLLANRRDARRLADILQREPVVNDTVGPQNLVIITNPTSMAVRAYERGDHTFKPGVSTTELIDESGVIWQIEETSLMSNGGSDSFLKRLPGHDAFWFGWFAANPRTKLYSGLGD